MSVLNIFQKTLLGPEVQIFQYYANFTKLICTPPAAFYGNKVL